MTLPRLRQLVIASETNDTIDTLKDVFGLGEPFPDPGVGEFGLVNGVFAIGDQFLEVVVPVAETAPAARFIARGGPGGYMAIFQTDDLEGVRTKADGMGIRRVWNADLEDISASHLHPADIGAAIVSVDEARPANSWRWGGPDWNRRSKAGRLTGAVIESPDPDALAKRWSEVLGAGLAGRKVQLEDAALEFAPAETERLVAFRMNFPDTEDILARAKRAGLAVDGQTIHVAGVSLVLE
ncbi:VOC family protein [Hyphomonas johnsonii]|uniref:Uncharacterized protein n=1 Tax=Hyphomonas johnsonii MHS-2 TaxID=1280950 RepID=A0A059FR17_9PROT|nr:VOC family protein [Hyphomonas johnsonii]KCZ92971.1 hypothetical protein HJO_08447 [Hyphomonas johnsonii MHS-2]